jgi:hypothetical protein
MPEEINFNLLAEKLSVLDINNWDAHLGWDRDSYETRPGNKFDISLSVNYKDRYFNADDKDYKLLVSSKLISEPITFNGKEVKNLFGLIEEKYKNKLKSAEKKDKTILVQNLNKFLQEK